MNSAGSKDCEEGDDRKDTDRLVGPPGFGMVVDDMGRGEWEESV